MLKKETKGNQGQKKWFQSLSYCLQVVYVEDKSGQKHPKSNWRPTISIHFFGCYWSLLVYTQCHPGKCYCKSSALASNILDDFWMLVVPMLLFAGSAEVLDAHSHTPFFVSVVSNKNNHSQINIRFNEFSVKKKCFIPSFEQYLRKPCMDGWQEGYAVHCNKASSIQTGHCIINICTRSKASFCGSELSTMGHFTFVCCLILFLHKKTALKGLIRWAKGQFVQCCSQSTHTTIQVAPLVGFILHAIICEYLGLLLLTSWVQHLL